MAYLNTSWHHIRRSPYQAFAAVLLILQTFFVFSIFAHIIAGSSEIITYFESRPQLFAFFKDDATAGNINALQSQLESTGKIASIKFVSKQEALSIYQEQNKSDPLLLDLVTADILPSSLEISTKKIEDQESIFSVLNGSQIVKNVVFQKDIIETLTMWTDALRKIGIALIVVLALDSILLMVIIIGIKISQKREEIEIMRLLGATSWYVRWPFILEGIFYGLVGAFVGWSFSTLALLYATPFLSSVLRGIPLFPVPPMYLLGLLGVELGLAIILGFFASFLAVLRYLK